MMDKKTAAALMLSAWMRAQPMPVPERIIKRAAKNAYVRHLAQRIVREAKPL